MICMIPSCTDQASTEMDWWYTIHAVTQFQQSAHVCWPHARLMAKAGYVSPSFRQLLYGPTRPMLFTE